VWIDNELSPPESPTQGGAFYRAERTFEAALKDYRWTFTTGTERLRLEDIDPAWFHVRTVSLTVTTIPDTPGVLAQTWQVALDPSHESYGARDSLFELFREDPANQSQALSLPIVVTRGQNIDDGGKVLQALLNSEDQLLGHLLSSTLPPDLWRASSDLQRSLEIRLENGNDGQRPGAPEYEGRVDPVTDRKTGLKILEDLEDISIVAAPGSTRGYEDGFRDDAQSIINLLMIHASQMRYRIAVLDSGDGQSVAQVQDLRAKLNSKYAAPLLPMGAGARPDHPAADLTAAQWIRGRHIRAQRHTASRV